MLYLVKIKGCFLSCECTFKLTDYYGDKFRLLIFSGVPVIYMNSLLENLLAYIAQKVHLSVHTEEIAI